MSDIAGATPTYFLSPCGSHGTVFMNDKQKTSFFITRQEDGEIAIDGATYKKEGGSKTDPKTGEKIQFDILEDGSHKETRRFPKDYDTQEAAADLAALVKLAHRIKVLIEKGDKAAEKAEQFYKSAGIHIKEIKQQSEDWETIVREQCGLGRSRAYELMAIADGRTTLEKIRASANERKKVHRAKPSVPERTERDRAMLDAIADGDAGDCEACIIAAREPERATGSAEVSTEQRKAEMAALDTGAGDGAAEASARHLGEFIKACWTHLESGRG